MTYPNQSYQSHKGCSLPIDNSWCLAIRMETFCATHGVIPPIKLRRAVRAQNNVNMDPTVLNALPVSDLCGLCQQNGLPSTAQRSTLERRITSLHSVSAFNANSGPNGEASDLNLNKHLERPRNRNSIFSEDQIAELQRVVKESVASPPWKLLVKPLGPR